MSSIFNQVTQEFKKLPGIGPKLAEKLTFHLIYMNEGEVKKFSDSLFQFKKKIKLCPICGLASEYNPCKICSSPNRDKSILCIVKNIQDAFFLEKSKSFHGIYHVLNSINQIGKDIIEEDLDLEPIKKRLNGVREIVFALEPSIESDIAIKEMKSKLENSSLLFSRLAVGIPSGLPIEYLDNETIKKALSFRTAL